MRAGMLSRVGSQSVTSAFAAAPSPGLPWRPQPPPFWLPMCEPIVESYQFFSLVFLVDTIISVSSGPISFFLFLSRTAADWRVAGPAAGRVPGPCGELGAAVGGRQTGGVRKMGCGNMIRTSKGCIRNASGCAYTRIFFVLHS